MAKKRNRRARRARHPSRLPRTAPELTQGKLRELEGRRETENRGEGVFPVERVEERGEPTEFAIYEGELASGDDDERLDLLTELELRAGETDDAHEAAAEGLSYVPPTDPPVVPGTLEGAQVASGFGASALDEPYDADHRDEPLPADDEVTARVREALLADSSTSASAERVEIETSGGRVVLRGVVDDLTDAESMVAVASDATGVAEVVDQLTIRALERGR